MLIFHTYNKHNRKNEWDKFAKYALCASEYISSFFSIPISTRVYLKEKHIPIKIHLSSNNTVGLDGMGILENTETNKVIFFSYGDGTGLGDSIKSFFTERPDSLCCVFKYQYGKNSKLYQNIKTFPFTYTPSNFEFLDNFVMTVQDLDYDKKIDRVFFAGKGTSKLRRQLMKNKENLYPNWTVMSKRLSKKDFFSEIQKSRFCLSLPGHGPNCHREIECFAIGSVVVSPEIPTVYSNPLIPGYHYVAIPYDMGMPYDTLQEECHNKIKLIDKDMYQFIQNNALTWFSHNVKLPESVKYVMKKDYLDYLSKHFI